MFGIQFTPLMRQYAVVIIVNLSVVCVGFGLAWPSPVLVKLRNETDTVLSRPVTEEEGSWIVSIGSLVAAFANFLPAVLVDRIGRKYSILIACVPKVAICLLFTFATEVWMLLLGRAVLGISDAMLFSVVPMYASEIASKEVRGALGTILQIFSSIGILGMLGIGPFVSYVSLNVIFTCMTVLTTIPILFLPDSPYFLYSKGKTTDTMEVLTFLRGSKAAASEEIDEYSLAITSTNINKKELLNNKVVLKTLGIVVVLGAGIQLTGFNAVQFYLQTILESTNTSIRPEFASLIIGFIQLIASICTAFVTDKFGRKPILTTTLIGMAIGMIGLGTFFQTGVGNNFVTGIWNFVPLVSLILIVFCFGAGPGSVYWILITELFDGPTRAFGVYCSMTASTIFMFLITKYFPLATNAIGPASTYWIFGVICVLFCIFILFCVPETKGKSFAEIQVALGNKSLVNASVKSDTDNDNKD